LYKIKEMRVLQETGLWSWLFQRITGILIGPLLVIHIWSIHPKLIGYDTISRFLPDPRSPLFLFLDLILLAFVIYHTLNGFRVVLIDLGIDDRGQRILFWTFMVLGAALFSLAVYAFSPLMLGRPLF
jgi:succinate dehydrogenase cytochrome b subunit